MFGGEGPPRVRKANRRSRILVAFDAGRPGADPKFRPSGWQSNVWRGGTPAGRESKSQEFNSYGDLSWKPGRGSKDVLNQWVF